MDADLQALNQQFSIPGCLTFLELPGKMAGAVINNRFGSAEIYLAGAHVMSYRPHGGLETLWTSPSAAYVLGNEMRGGIPICWPWFAHQGQESKNALIHGFARTQLFSVVRSRVLAGGATELAMQIAESPDTLALWPHAFQLEIVILVSNTLSVTWKARNTGGTPFSYTGALHPYFAVSDVHQLTLRGLERTEFLDKYKDFQRKTQNGEIKFPAAIDSVFLNTEGDLAIEDPGYQRTIYLRKTGSSTSVVWNPGDEDAAIPDVGSGQHRHFLCVEAANAADNIITVNPGNEARLSMEIEVRHWGKP